MFDSTINQVSSITSPRALSPGALSFIFFLVGLIFLTAYQILVPFGLNDVNPSSSGFHDDRNYSSSTVVASKLGSDFSLVNSGYWFVCYVVQRFMPFDVVFTLKVINLGFLSLTYHTFVKLAERMAYRRINGVLFYLFIPAIAVVSKEWMAIFLCFKLVDIFTNPQATLRRYPLLIILGFALLVTKYVYFFTLILFMVLSRGLRNKLQGLAVGIIIFGLLALTYSFVSGLAEQFILLRFIEMSSEGANYGLSSASGTLSDRFSGSPLYSLFQFAVLPIPASFNHLYNLYFPLMPFFACCLVYISVYFREMVNRYAALMVTFISYSSLVVLINFGANYRYKLLPIMLAFSLVTIHGAGYKRFNFLVGSSVVVFAVYCFMSYFRF